ncbi:hypothetical protein FOXG_18769 [Fusarium oxysporum f. sp. lycopersici 4287]|uniref:Uncharacterized protein n=1 Tax=Fusarium oxysporum f. sp. lycopersici (strain 4287 / CBS 123668 / FGSC 9935 / NRRL 34936) TaxID=426428 RepID=A0A0J9WJR7_FUSO4|nr:hypothetical protein FOXG_18769 [Fusarium oxysporum f. sp. lycopersici 4287]KNB00752.1 hypothetical protein FOXG_18769 [Fusarium oxysporum f. sp. lycopersici 4287]
MSGRSHRHPSNFPPTFIGFRRDWESACGIVLCTYLPTLTYCEHSCCFQSNCSFANNSKLAAATVVLAVSL